MRQLGTVVCVSSVRARLCPARGAREGRSDVLSVVKMGSVCDVWDAIGSGDVTLFIQIFISDLFIIQNYKQLFISETYCILPTVL